jgi:hypothetical protein
MTATEIKWIFPSNLVIVPNRKLSVRISIENPKEDSNTFAYYVY